MIDKTARKTFQGGCILPKNGCATSADRTTQSLFVFNEILMTCMDDNALQEQLGAVLDIVFSTSWFDLKPKGCVFIKDANTDVLTLLVQRNFDNDQAERCRKIDLGECLCGKAFRSEEILFTSDEDERHAIQHEGMTRHAHYCVPLVARKQKIGLLNLYLDADHESTRDEKKFLQVVSLILAEIIDHWQLKEKIEHLAAFDQLTGLPNRSLFHDRLNQAVAMANRTGKQTALMFIDLDHFKKINDTMGHAAGDQLLKEAAQRISACIRATDTAARLGGDEFTVILQEVADSSFIEFVALRILESFFEPFYLDAGQVSVSASIGISVYLRDAVYPENMLINADKAMYEAKAAGRGTYRFFDANLNSNDNQEPTGDQ